MHNLRLCKLPTTAKHASVNMQTAAPPAPSAPLSARLRILATSDLHMHLLAHDYFSDSEGAPFGLARVASRIAAHRAEAENCLLLDNGDLLQGNLLGDHLAGAGARNPHPAIACLNRLGYDATTLGNHDFSFGLRALSRVLAGARYPVVLANAATPGHKPPFTPWVRLDRRIACADGSRQPLGIGIIGFLPPQTPQWEPELAGQLTCTDMLEAAAQYLPQMRAAGCAVIVALCHGGIQPGPHRPGAENAAAALAGLDIDAVVAGHTHLTFPGPDTTATALIDPLRGMLSGKPAVMPGFWGSHLGVIDLSLRYEGSRWHITAATARAESCATAPPCPDLPAPVIAADRAARRHFARRIGASTVPLNSHFTQIGHDAGLALIARASRWHLRRALERQAGALPILTAAAPFRSGGRGGPESYTQVPAGPISLRALTDLYLFPNHLAALRVTGADLRDWLERASAQFNRLRPGLPDQPLLNPRFPGYNFDVILGLNWQFDLSEPPLYHPDGSRAGDGPGRVRGLTHRGRPVAPDQPFILATNSYRLGAHGLFAPLAARAPPLLAQGPRLRDVLARYLRRCRSVAPAPCLGWEFAPIPGASALFPTAPGANAPIPAMAPAGRDTAGFALWRLDLDAPPCIRTAPALSGG